MSEIAHYEVKDLIQKAKQGDLQAQHLLCYAYSTGDGVELDNKKAIDWGIKAMEQGCSTSTHNLATIYRDQQDYSLAFKYYKKAYEMGSISSKINIANYYQFGIGVDKDSKKAIQLYKEYLALKDEPEGLKQDCFYYLGLAYLIGDGIKKCLKAAKEYFEAANKDNDHLAAHEMLLLLGVN